MTYRITEELLITSVQQCQYHSNFTIPYRHMQKCLIKEKEENKQTNKTKQGNKKTDRERNGKVEEQQ